MAPTSAVSRVVKLGTTQGPLALAQVALLPRNLGTQLDVNGLGTSNGTDVSMTDFVKIKCPYGARAGYRLLYLNTYNADSNPPNPIIISSVSYDNTAYGREAITFNGFNSTVISPGGFALSDPIGQEIAVNGSLAIYSYVSTPNTNSTNNASTEIIPFLGNNNFSNNVGTNRVSAGGDGSDITYTNSPGFNPNNTVFAPSALLGFPLVFNSATPIIDVYGDSIFLGVNAGTGTRTDWGWANWAINLTYPSQRMAQGGLQMADLASATGGRARQLKALTMSNSTHVICNLGVNDILNGRTFSQWQTDALVTWVRFKNLGRRFYQGTLLPKTTSTDGFITAVNQSYPSGFAPGSHRDNINIWLRDGAPITVGGTVLAPTYTPVATGTVGATRAGSATHPLMGIFDVALAVDDGNGKWTFAAGPTAYTSDGTHPNNAATALIGALFTPSSFRIL